MHLEILGAGLNDTRNYLKAAPKSEAISGALKRML
jgi:hypothetical protein